MAGQYFDSETGLHYNFHRYYDPKTGRYITPDPIGLAGGINLYAYTANNPLNGIDPYGLFDIALTPYAVAAAPAIAMADSPFLPFGDMAAGALIGIAMLHDKIEDGVAAPDDDGEACQDGKERGLGEKWGDFINNPSDWEKVDERDDPRQPTDGYSRREKWRNKKTGEEIGIHQKYPSGNTRKGQPKHPHPFPPEAF